jgi:hypothetical protein
MPGVADFDVIPDSESRTFQFHEDDILRHSSPDGRFELEFSRPREIAMGADTWGRLQVRRDGHDITAECFSSETVFGMSIAGLPFFHPWDRSATRFAIPEMGRQQDGQFVFRTTVYNVARKEVERQFDGGWHSGIVWSPAKDQMLLIRAEEAEIFSLAGTHRTIGFPSHSGDGVLGGWTPDGEHVVLSPPADSAQYERLQFVNAVTGRLTEEASCNPLELLPFDQSALDQLASGRQLVYPDGRHPEIQWDPEWAIEALMHHWSDGLYDQSTCSLLLSTFRPTFELVPVRTARWKREIGLRDQPGRIEPSPLITPRGSEIEEDSLACVMKKSWIRVRLAN